MSKIFIFTMSLRKTIVTGAGMLLAAAALAGCKPSNSGLENVAFDPNHGRLNYSEVDYIKDIRLTSGAVNPDDYVRCTMEVSYKEEGKEVDKSSNFVEIKPNALYEGVLMAHVLPIDVMLGNKPAYFDEVVLRFKSSNNPNVKLPDPIILPITPKHIYEYRNDFASYAACREMNLRESAKKSGISSGRY